MLLLAKIGVTGNYLFVCLPCTGADAARKDPVSQVQATGDRAKVDLDLRRQWALRAVLAAAIELTGQYPEQVCAHGVPRLMTQESSNVRSAFVALDRGSLVDRQWTGIFHKDYFGTCRSICRAQGRLCRAIAYDVLISR